MDFKTDDNNNLGESKISQPPPEEPIPPLEHSPPIDNPPVEENPPPKSDGIKKKRNIFRNIWFKSKSSNFIQC